MTDRNERLKGIRERLSAATPGPWHTFKDSDGDIEFVQANHATGCDEQDECFSTVGIIKLPVEKYGYGCAWASEPNAELIANAPSDIEYLLALVERYEKALEFYADLKNWRTVTVSNKNQRFCIMTGADLEYFQEPNQDSYCGKRAREALEAGERE